MGVLKMAPSGSPRKHVSKARKNGPKDDTPHPTAATDNNQHQNKDILSSRRHSMDYVTADGVFLRTGHADKKTWYFLCLKELWDNCVDFLWRYYQGASDAFVTTEITMTNNSMFHVKVRNSNSKNIPVFQNLPATFDFDMRYGSKQNLRIISRGMLGDAMKQILAWAYVLIHTTKEGNGNGFVDRQWDKPLIIRHNGLECHVFLNVDKANQTIHADIRTVPVKLSHTHTEIELTWPILDDVDLDIRSIERFCKIYTIPTTDISFRFRLVDNSKPKPKPTDSISASSDYIKWKEEREARKNNPLIASELIKALSSPARKAAIIIERPAVHPIATGWSNTSSIHCITPEEFVSSFITVYDKQSNLVYDVLKQHREGSNLKKTDDNRMSIADLMLDSDRHKKIEGFYHQLDSVMGPPKRLSLPYPINDFNKRKQPLVYRITHLYPELLDADKAVYKAANGFHDGDGYTLLHYPFMFEVVAVPFNDKALDNNTNRATEFFGFVNYSISPKGNNFEGKYEWYDKNWKWSPKTAHDIIGFLEHLKFEFEEYSASMTKLPCIIVANLVSPRIDYHGHDKSRIDTAPFVETIMSTIRKMAEGIRTFRGLVIHLKASMTASSLPRTLRRR